MTDPVNHPPHYKSPSGIEAIDVIEGFGLGFHLGNVVKYILRAGKKEALLQDLRKARWYLDRRIAALTGAADNSTSVLQQYRLCYLATPYTGYRGGRINDAFSDASEIAAALLTTGIRVYSPIAHCHPIAVFGQLDPLDHSVWIPFDEAMMEAADCLIVAHMDGWEDSFGIKHEIDFFTKDGKPVFDLDPASMVITRRRPAESEAAA